MSSSRRATALAAVHQKRSTVYGGAAVDLNCLIRIFLLDGSFKVLQITEASTAEDVLCQLKYNLDLQDISTHALFRVMDRSIRRIELNENLKEALKDTTEKGGTVRILFRSWIVARSGCFEKEVFQDNIRHKMCNTALWLAYMEATFMCMANKYYLSEDEAIMLGCLRMQAESGDFNPAIHTLENIKLRVASRFPNPVRAHMRALESASISGNGLSDAIAERVQFLYARIAGKHKAEAQIDSLNLLRTWCPFFGATFFVVQCQYDTGQSEAEPPVTTMNAAVGPLALFLITTENPPVILRHPFKRIVKWLAYRDKHIFSYFVLKPGITLHDIERAQAEHEASKGSKGGGGAGDEEFDAAVFCDCVYLVTPLCSELESLVKSYVLLLKDGTPKLRGARGELLPPNMQQSADEIPPVMKVEKEKIEAKKTKRVGRFQSLFSAFGGGGDSRRGSIPNGATGIDADSGDSDNEGGGYGDDVSGLSRGMFKGMYRRKGTPRGSVRGSDAGDDDDAPYDSDDDSLPGQIKFAASMSELQRLAEERFSDEEESEDGEDDSESDAEEDAEEESKSGSAKSVKSVGGTAVSSEGTFSRISKILFGRRKSTSSPKKLEEEEEEEEEEDDEEEQEEEEEED